MDRNNLPSGIVEKIKLRDASRAREGAKRT